MSFARLLWLIGLGGCVVGANAADPQSSQQSHKRFVADVVVNPRAYYPEGPQLIAAGLLVAEMSKNRVVLLADGGSKVVWQAVEPCGPTSIKRMPDEQGYWVLCHLGNYVVRLNNRFETVTTLTATTSGRRITWPNDASMDSAGNLYLSSSGQFSLGAPPEGRVVFIDRATNMAVDVVGGLHYSNGVLVQERLKRILVSEHLNRRVLVLPLPQQGKPGKPAVFFDFRNAPPVADSYEQSGPDGIAAFADGDLCVADYGNGRILVLSSSGRFLTQIEVAYRFVTNLAISPDQTELFVTMTRDNLSPELDGIVQRFKVIRTH